MLFDDNPDALRDVLKTQRRDQPPPAPARPVPEPGLVPVRIPARCGGEVPA
ncbi:hypothetical protein LI90_4008 [Carbonactinospora thermoautotrophica]|uniref:Uncharacterized protein n=2 Tax=Carbonactinospora thermoautotrophica TaxID=1469144 RepID=A0A132MYK4_9ACTN|nr:hypothetical protein LI90_4008 [Carbonactinospora thermoautotrophica]